MVIKYECKCDRCSEKYEYTDKQFREDEDSIFSTYTCPKCMALKRNFEHAFYYPIGNSPEDKKELSITDYINMAYLYANKFTIYNITNLYCLPESVVRNIIFDIKAGDTPRAKEVLEALKKKYGIESIANKAGERLRD